MASPETTSVIVPAHNEAAAIRDVVAGLQAAAGWHEVLVIDDGSTDGTASVARAAGAVVISQPYRKGNGAAVKTGLRHATGEYILIIDGDGQHRVEDAVRLVGRLGECDLVVGSRSTETQATLWRRFGNAALNGLAGYLTQHLLHLNIEQLGELWRKQTSYAIQEAQSLYHSGRRARWRNFVGAPLREFRRRYITLGGYRDGVVGLLLCATLAYFEWVKFVHLKGLEQT